MGRRLQRVPDRNAMDPDVVQIVPAPDKEKTNANAPLKRTDFNNDLALDTGATFSSMRNEDLLAGVHEADRPMKMCTNTGARCVTECGEMLGVKADPWLDDELMANIVSFSELKEQCRMTHDSDHVDSFLSCRHRNH